MKILALILPLSLITTINSNSHNEEILKTDLDRPYQLAVDIQTNTLYFSYSIEKDGEDSRAAKLNLDNKEFHEIKGVFNGFAQTIDRTTNTVYIGGSNGIFKYNNDDKSELLFDGFNIWNMFYKDALYFSTFPSHFLYIYSNGEATRFRDVEDTKVDSFVIDNEDIMYYTNSSGFYSQPIGSKNATLIKEFEFNGVRGMNLDSKGDVFLCFADGIYVLKKLDNVLEKVVDVNDVFGVAFDKNDNLVYADANKLVRLKPSNDLQGNYS